MEKPKVSYKSLIEQIVLFISQTFPTEGINESDLREIEEKDNLLGNLDEIGNEQIKNLFTLTTSEKDPNDELSRLRQDIIARLFLVKVCEKYPNAIGKGTGVRKGLKLVWFELPPRGYVNICIGA